MNIRKQDATDADADEGDGKRTWCPPKQKAPLPEMPALYGECFSGCNDCTDNTDDFHECNRDCI